MRRFVRFFLFIFFMLFSMGYHRKIVTSMTTIAFGVSEKSYTPYLLIGEYLRVSTLILTNWENWPSDLSICYLQPVMKSEEFSTTVSPSIQEITPVRKKNSWDLLRLTVYFPSTLSPLSESRVWKSSASFWIKPLLPLLAKPVWVYPSISPTAGSSTVHLHWLAWQPSNPPHEERVAAIVGVDSSHLSSHPPPSTKKLHCIFFC